jgi:hypothetical protein
MPQRAVLEVKVVMKMTQVTARNPELLLCKCRIGLKRTRVLDFSYENVVNIYFWRDKARVMHGKMGSLKWMGKKKIDMPLFPTSTISFISWYIWSMFGTKNIVLHVK